MIDNNNQIEPASFDSLYLKLREHEGRIYSDKEVQQLPEIHNDHVYFKEWMIRRDSYERLIKYLVAKEKSLNILEVGSGNGWLSAKLATIPGSNVLGLEINICELNQAIRVFNRVSNLAFKKCDISKDVLTENNFDIILFAATIQYFSSFELIINKSLDLLKEDGELHIIDSHFYDKTGIPDARKRSAAYFSSLGFAEMKEMYFHHSKTDYENYNHRILYQPGKFAINFRRVKNPFPWICITK